MLDSCTPVPDLSIPKYYSGEQLNWCTDLQRRTRNLATRGAGRAPVNQAVHPFGLNFMQLNIVNSALNVVAL